MRAVLNRSPELVKTLLAAGAEADAKDSYGDTPLIQAVRAGTGDIVQMLVEKGANVNAVARDGNTTLHFAASQGFANLARFLIEKGASVNAANGNLNTPADVAEKEYPGLAKMIRGEAAPPAEIAPAADSSWKLVAPDEIAHVAIKDAIGYRVTEIFNFKARTYTHIACNLESRAESQAVKAFSDLDGGGLVGEAYQQLVRLGGRAEYEAAVDKKKLPSPGGGGP